jgi:putative membrane protein
MDGLTRIDRSTIIATTIDTASHIGFIMVRPWVSIHHTPVFRVIGGVVAALTLYAAVVVALDLWVTVEVPALVAQFHGFLGLILGTLLVFRTNTSYDRWWEGRKLWGQLVNDIRNLAIKVETCVRADVAEKRNLGRRLVDFAYSLKAHLRGEVRLTDFPEVFTSKDQPPPHHVPAHIAARIYEQLEAWRQADQLGGFELLFLDQHAASLMNVCGACERIQHSPISLSYRWFIRQSIAIYLITIPWGLMHTFGWWTVPAVAMIGYFMAGVEAIAEQIEDPFGVDQDDLKLDELCKTIDRSVMGILAQAPSPATPARISAES